MNLHCFLGLSYMPLGPPDPEVPTAGQPSETESGPSLEKTPHGRGQLTNFIPSPLNRLTQHRCVEKWLLLAKLPKEPGVQLILQMLHLERSPPKPFSSSLQTGAQNPTARCLPSSPWGLQFDSTDLSMVFLYPSFLLSNLGSFWSVPSGLPLLHAK